MVSPSHLAKLEVISGKKNSGFLLRIGGNLTGKTRVLPCGMCRVDSSLQCSPKVSWRLWKCKYFTSFWSEEIFFWTSVFLSELSKQNFNRIYGNKNIRISIGVNLLSMSNVHVVWPNMLPSRHGPDFHRPQSQITIDSPDFHLRWSQNCLLGCGHFSTISTHAKYSHGFVMLFEADVEKWDWIVSLNENAYTVTLRSWDDKECRALLINICPWSF